MAFTEEQKQAIFDSEKHNILVSAGAGSGKTMVLSERVLRKVKEGVSIDKILILTFTKAAASSMKDKIRKKLIENNLNEAVNMIDKAYITTFDSFASSIVKKYHDRLNIKRDFNIVDKTSIDLYKKEALDQIFNKYYDLNDIEFNKLITDLCLKNDKALKNDILSLNDKLDLKYDKLDYLNNYILEHYNNTYLNKYLDQYKKRVFRLQNKIIQEVKNLEFSLDSDVMDEINKVLLPLLKASTYQEIKDSLDISLPRFQGNKYTDDAKTSKKLISKYIEKLEKLCILNEKDLEQYYLDTKTYASIIVKILLELDSMITSFKLKHNVFEFNDISKFSIELVKKHSDIKEELTNFFDEIMIDEYQDTSDLQEEFISEIANNNVYMVGDIKQSIYRFRNANPNIFKDKYEKYKNNDGGIKIDLNKNFRSREEDLVDINTIFDKVMDIDYGGANYKDSHRMIYGNIDYKEEGSTTQDYTLDVYNYLVDKDSKYSEYKKYEIEAFIIAKDIKDKIANDYKIYDKDLGLRKAKYSDFSIIISASKHFETYKKVFEYFNIPLTVCRDINIANSEEFYIIKNILKLLDGYINNRYDDQFKYSFISVARSYLFRLSDQEIYNIVNNNTYLDTDIIKCIDLLSKETNYLDLKNLILRIKDIFNFEIKFIEAKDVAIRISTLEYLVKLACDLTNMDYDYHMFIKYLDNIYEDSESKIEIPVSIEEENSVILTTIHGSKGLEYPVCYFPEIDSLFNLSDTRSKIFFDNLYGIVLPNYTDGYNDTFIKVEATKKAVKEEISEKIRLFYVALTRVKEKMIIISSIDKDEIKEKESFRSFKDILVSVKEDLVNYIKDVDLDSLELNSNYSILESKDLDDFNLEEISVKEYDNQSRLEEDKHYSKTVKELATLESINNMKYGTRIHNIFEMVDFNNLDLDKLDIETKEKEYINNFLNQDLLKNIKEANILKEYEFYDDNSNGIIDLMLEYNDHIDIIDYKLKHIDDSAYINQLNGYKEYISKKTGKKVSTYLYSISDNKIIELM